MQPYQSDQLAKRGSAKDATMAKWQERLKAGLADRRRYEPIWHLCQAYLAGRQWVAWAPRERRIISLSEVNEWKMRERHTVNVLTPHVWNMISRVMSEQLRPDVTWRREDIESEKFAEECKAAWEYAWEEEVKGDDALLPIFLKEFTYGTAAGRCYFDPSVGRRLGQLPLDDEGRPITDLTAATQFVAEKQQYGERVQFKDVREGRTIWEPLSPFNIVTPPGVEREEDFPWLIILRPLAVERAKLMWPNKASLIEAEELTSVDLMGLRDSTPGSDDPFSARSGKLEEHILVATGYEMPCPEYPDGYTYVWGNEQELEQRNQLPYELDGVGSHGVVFFHYHKVEGRFWAQGMVEKGIGVQRQINRARSQNIEMKDRNLGRVYSYRGTITEANDPVGKIMEHIEVSPGHEFPKETAGVAPGAWVAAEAEISMRDLDLVLGMSDVQQGMAPAGVTAYAALSLLAEQAERSIQPIISGARRGIRQLAKLTLHNVRLYWPSQKLIVVAGPDNVMQSYVFTSTQLPEQVYVTWPEGSPAPHSPASEIQKIFDLYDRSVAGGRPLPITWLEQSIRFQKAQEIPEIPGEAQTHKAELENMLMARGQQVFPRLYDDDMLHVEVHRAAQAAQDLLPGNEPMVQLYEMHIQAHVQAFQQKMMMAQQAGAFMQPAATAGGGMPPPFAGAEQTASQRGPLNDAGSPAIAGE